MTETEIVNHFQSNSQEGLSDKEAKARLKEFGPNQSVKANNILWTRLFLRQFKRVYILLPLMAGFVGAICFESMPVIALAAMLGIMAVVNANQEYRETRLFQKLAHLSGATARVIRNGREHKVPFVELVPGDIVFLAEGELVPADLRLVQADRLEVDESIFAKTSLPVRKESPAVLQAVSDLSTFDNMVYMKTAVLKGRGRGIVVHTGTATAISYAGRRFQKSTRGHKRQPFHLETLGKGWVAFAFFAGLFISAVSFFRGGIVPETYLAGLGLLVAAMPVGLPLIVSRLRVVGVKRVSKHGALIRKHTALEALGDTTAVCLNQAAILTKEELVVHKIVLAGKTITVTGKGYDPKGAFGEQTNKQGTEFNLLLKAAALCNNSVLKRGNITVAGLFRAGEEAGGRWSVEGDSTEGALLALAAKAGFWREKLGKEEEWVGEVAFTPERRRMSVVYRKSSGALTAYVKGAPEVVLEHCTHGYRNGKVTSLSEQDKEQIKHSNILLAQEGLRVLAFACRQIPTANEDVSEQSIEKELVFLGLAGMMAPLAAEVVSEMQTLQRAANKVLLFSGDQLGTVQVLAQKIGLTFSAKNILTGRELETMSDGQLCSRIGQISICARVTPQHKIRIIKALQQSGAVVAVNGSTPEDAVVVQEADIGIAMNHSEAAVTKEVSDLLLEKESLTCINAAIGEGRVFQHSLHQSLQFLLAGSLGAMLVILLAAWFGFALPLMPGHILWVGLLSTLFLFIVWGAAPTEPQLMLQLSCYSRPYALRRKFVWNLIGGGTVICVCVLLVSWFVLAVGGSTQLARTMAFNTLFLSQLSFVLVGYAQAYRGWSKGIFKHLSLISALCLTCLLQYLVNYSSLLSSYMQIIPLNVWQWVYILGVSVLLVGFATSLKSVCGQIGRKIMYLRVRPE